MTANDFLHRSSVLKFTREGLERVADDVRLLAKKEGLTGHAASVDIRLTKGQRAESRGQKSEVRGQKSEVGNRQ